MTQATMEMEDQLGVQKASGREVVLQCTGLTKVFRDFWLRNRVRAVDGLDLDVRRGEVFGLLGPNGSGKSTTIKMVLGLLHPSAGRISVFGKRPDDVKTKEQIGYLPEESHLYRFLTARETLDYYGRLFHQNRVTRKRRIDELLHMVGLDAVQRRPVGEYSKGMQRRIGIAQALINDPQLLILDEPTSGLDPLGTRQIKDLIVSLKERGKTILLSSHLLADVEDVCDRVSIMFGGKVRRHGTVDELLTEGGASLIQTHDLTQEAVDAIEAVLVAHGTHIDKIDRPRQKLEKLFLDIVQQAQTEGVATGGARSGRAIAAFLQSGGDGTQPGDADGKTQGNVGDVGGVIEGLLRSSEETLDKHADKRAGESGGESGGGGKNDAVGHDASASAETKPQADDVETPDRNVIDSLINPDKRSGE